MSSPLSHSSCGKRPRTPPLEKLETTDGDEEPSAKIPRRPQLDDSCPSPAAANHHRSLEGSSQNLASAPVVLSLAPKLSDFLAPGGTVRFRPRPEWCRGLGGNTRTRIEEVDVQPEAAAAPMEELSDDEGNEDHQQRIPEPPPVPRRDDGLLVAPENGLLPEHAFEDFLARGAAQPAQPAQVADQDGDRTMMTAVDSSNRTSEETSSLAEPKPSVFGKDWDPALHVAIREHATEAALVLMESGAPVEAVNVKGVTALIIAAQKGNLVVAKELLKRGADPATASINGSTAVLQAAHFGHFDILILLLKCGGKSLVTASNYNYTTPLMRASQEGHYAVVKLLLESGAQVNRRNRVHMTALMLASQRGHSDICSLLIDYGAELDAMTNQDSTSLLLACKRGNVQVVRVLVTAGCELWKKDSRGRTAKDVAQRRSNKELTDLLDSSVQVDLMQRQSRRERSFSMIKHWNLLQQERASVMVENDVQVGIHDIESTLQTPNPPFLISSASTRTLIRSMTLPAPLVETIAQFLPLPNLWPKRMGMLTQRSIINPDAAVTSALDLIDEVLEEGGFLEACDAALLTPPTNFESWREWKAWGRRRGRVAAEQPRDRNERLNVTTATVPPPLDPERPTFLELRRQAGFLQILANRSPLLARVLALPPYNMSPSIIQQLITVSDIASLARRMGSNGIHFESTAPMDLVMLISRLYSWYQREREDAPNTIVLRGED